MPCRIIGIFMLLLKGVPVLLVQASLMNKMADAAVTVSVEPLHTCLCPSHYYTCSADDVARMAWGSASMEFETISYTVLDTSEPLIVNRDGLRVQFMLVMGSIITANFTSHLLITEPATWNGSNFTCEANTVLGSNDTVIVNICVIGTASPPTDLSVVCNSSSAMVSFQPPVYGGECVDHYVVLAVSEERNVSCEGGSDDLMYTCSLPSDSNMNDYNFTVYSVTSGVDGILYFGSTATDCCLPFPESVDAVEKECGVQFLIHVSWESSHSTSDIPIISWRSANSSEIHYELASSEDSHLLTIDTAQSVTGPLEVSVKFSSAACNKTSVTDIYVEEILTSVSLKATELTIESRDCIARPENYSIVITITNTDTGLNQTENNSFNTTVQYSLEDEQATYLIRVKIVHIPSNTAIDEWDPVIIYAPPTPATDPGVTTMGNVTVQPTTADADTTYIAAAVGGTGGLLVMVLVVAVFIAAIALRNRQSKHDPVPFGGGDELKILGMRSQASIEERRYEPPTIAAPLQPQTESTAAPDVVPASGPLYEDLNTLTANKEDDQVSSPPPAVYHVLEGPTPAPPDWENRTKQTKDDVKKAQ